jgi:alpha-L-rhamnosidase
VPVPYLRCPFVIESSIKDARLYVSSLGVYEAYLNGDRVGDAELAPGWTDYNYRVRYQAYDVTASLHVGENCLGALLGDGWYCGHLGWKDRQNYGDRPKLIAQIVVTLEDGTQTIVTSDASWKFGFGAILESDMLMGESQDLRREPTGWNTAGFDDSGWLPVEVSAETVKLVASAEPVVKVIEEIAPVSVVERPNWPTSRWMVDLGQNMVGRVRLKVSGDPGATVVLRFAERLNTDGSLYVTNYRGARSIDTFTLTGNGEEILEPKFTFHGFQFVEVAGLAKLSVEDIRGVVLHSAWEPSGEFECSDALINQLQHNIQWGWKGNSVDVPTDCPQRDERLGWTGDAQVFVRTACFNANVATFFEKFQQDLEDSQSADGQIPPVAPIMEITGADGGPAWSDAFLICPWTIYRCFGDLRILEKHYDAMRAWVDSLKISSRDLIRSFVGYKGFVGFGDWLSTNADTPIDLIGTAFYAHCASLLSQIAGILDKQEDAASYASLGADVKAAFNHRFVTADGIVAPGSQTAYVLALHFDLLPENLRAKAIDNLVYDIEKRGWKLSTGFVGTPYLNHVLTAGGRLDVAYRLLLQRDWPSWLYSVTQGATTIWERWDGWTHDKGFQDPGMNSFNHYAYGAIGDWLYAVVAGIDLAPEASGYKRSLLHARPGGGLTYAKASLDSPYGLILSSWTLESGVFTWDVTVPANTSSTLILPPEASGASMDGNSVDGPVELHSGTYRITAKFDGTIS